MTTKEIQQKLNLHGFGPIKEDGLMGPNTLNAIKKFQKARGLEQDGKVGPMTEAALNCSVPSVSSIFDLKIGKRLTTSQIISKYGPPGASNLVIMSLPFTMRIAWDLKMITNKIQVHKDVAPKLKAALEEILETYGLDKIKELGIDLYGGCYNYRKMRGGNDWSRHSWAIAIDLDPARNTLKATHKTAQFAKEPYHEMIRIFYKHGFLSYGIERDMDWMHFEIAN